MSVTAIKRGYRENSAESALGVFGGGPTRAASELPIPTCGVSAEPIIPQGEGMT